MNETPEILINNAEVLIAMKQTGGWTILEREIEVMRKEAFSDWAALPIDAPVEKILRLKAQEVTLAELMRRLDDIITRGVEAREQMLETAKAKAEDAAFLDGRASGDDEINRLIRGPQISGPTTPQGAGQERSPAEMKAG